MLCTAGTPTTEFLDLPHDVKLAIFSAVAGTDPLALFAIARTCKGFNQELKA